MTTEPVENDTTNPELMPMPAIKHENEVPTWQQAQEKIAVPMTATQAKIDAVANLTMKAYERASTLQLTDGEIAALQVDFSDDAFLPGAAGKENLIYIQHAYLRDRLNQVFRPGQWSIIPRNRWAEDFKTQNGKSASRVYVEAMLMIRGCFVAEAVGEMEYYPHNAGQNYGDAVEGAKTAALRRCCKELGIGLQAWKKDWCEGWWQRKGHQNAPQSSGMAPVRRQESPKAQSTTQNAPQGKPAPFPTAKTRSWMIEKLQANPGSPSREEVTDFFRKCGCILDTEELEDLPLKYVAATESQVRLVCGCIVGFLNGEPAALGFPPHQEPEEAPKAKPAPKKAIPETADEPWRAFPVPFGKNAGVKLGELPKNTLFGFWANFEVQTEWKGKPVSEDKIAKDQAFRNMLDEAGEYYEFEAPEDRQ